MTARRRQRPPWTIVPSWSGVGFTNSEIRQQAQGGEFCVRLPLDIHTSAGWRDRPTRKRLATPVLMPAWSNPGVGRPSRGPWKNVSVRYGPNLRRPPRSRVARSASRNEFTATRHRYSLYLAELGSGLAPVVVGTATLPGVAGVRFAFFRAYCAPRKAESCRDFVATARR